MSTASCDSDSNCDAPDALGVLAQEFLSLKRQGAQPEIESYCDLYPDLAERIKNLFPTLLQMEGYAADVVSTTTQIGDSTQLPDCVGDFKIIREVGRGGMGIVYEAEQQSLGRRVALKVLPPSATLSSTSVERFRRESRAAARLHHSNIVPIFGVGEHEGLHYYVMQYIEGVGLDQVLLQLAQTHRRKLPDVPACTAEENRLPAAFGAKGLFSASALRADGSQASLSSGEHDRTYWNRVAIIGMRLAEALHFAHTQGVFHRDLKPANILFDLQGTVWLTDFGLAQVKDDLNLTHSGDIVGTLRYLAPERLNDQYSCQSDVYSLGITLYELLTLVPAFDELDRATLIRQIIQQDPKRPRSINASIPRDLETIILKSIEKEPGRRYADASQFASDLLRFANDRPILARRVAAAEQAWRWCRRNPIVAVLGLVVCALLLVLLGIWGMFSWVQGDRDRARSAQRFAEQMTQAASRAESKAKSSNHLSQAISYRHSQEPFRKSQGLSEIGEALHHRPSEDVKFLLRNEAIALLALTDLKSGHLWTSSSDQGKSMHFNHDLNRKIRLDRPGVFTVSSAQNDGFKIELKPERSSVGMAMLSDRGKFAILRDDAYKGLIEVWDVEQNRRVLGPLEDCWGLDINPSETEIAVYRNDRAVHFYGLADGKETSQFAVDQGVSSVAYSPEGNRIALASSEQNLIHVRECSTGRTVGQLVAEGNVNCLNWHPDGNRLAVSFSQPDDVEVWSVSELRRLTRMRGHTQSVTRVEFDKFGDFLVSASWDGTLRIWEMSTGNQVGVFTGSGQPHGGHETVIGLKLATSGLNSVELDRSRVFKRMTIGNEQDASRYICGDTDATGRLLFVGTYKGMECWDVERGCQLASIDCANTQAIYFDSTGGRLITGEPDGMYEWPIQQLDASWQVGPHKKLCSSQFDVQNTRYSDNGSRWAMIGDRQLRIMNRDGVLVREISVRDMQDNVCLSPDGNLVVTFGWHTPAVCVWNVATGELLHEFEAAQSSQYFTHDSKQLITGDADKYLFRDSAGWTANRTIPRGDCAFAGQVAFTSSGDLVALELGWGLIHLLRTDNYETVAVLEGPYKSRPTKYQFIDSGNALYCFHHLTGEIQIWQIDELNSRLHEFHLNWDESSPQLAKSIEASKYPRTLRFILPTTNEDSIAASKQQALRLAEENLAKDPDSLTLANLLAWELLSGSEKSRDPVRAIALLEKNSRSIPLDLNSRNTLAVGYYQVGRYDESIALLRENVKTQRDDLLGYDLYFLAMSLWQVGQQKESHEVYRWAERMLRIKPPPPDTRDELDQIRSEAAALIGF